MMRQLRLAGVLAAACVFFGMADQASAGVQGRTYAVYALSTVSGAFDAVLSFGAKGLFGTGNFTLVAENGETGAGTFTQNFNAAAVPVNAAGNNGAYQGAFTAREVNGIGGFSFIVGSGTGNVGDLFIFAGVTTP